MLRLVDPWEQRDLVVGDPRQVLDAPTVESERDSVRRDLAHVRNGNRELAARQMAGAHHDVGDVVVVPVDEEGLARPTRPSVASTSKLRRTASSSFGIRSWVTSTFSRG